MSNIKLIRTAWGSAEVKPKEASGLANPLEAHNSAMKNAPVQSNMHMRKYKVDQACCVASYVWTVCFTRRNMHSYGAYGKFVGNLSTVGSVQRCGHCGSHPDTPRLA